MRQSPPSAAGLAQQDQLKRLISLYNSGRLDEAIDLGERLVDQTPQAPMILNILGIANARLQRFDKAIECFSKAVKINPGFAEAHNNLGNTFKELGRYDEAISCYAKAVKVKPDFADAINNHGNALAALGRHDAAIQCFTQALNIKPDHAGAHYNLGNTLKALARYEEAIECFSKAVEIKPDFAEAHYNLGNTLVDLNRSSEAIKSYAKALRIRPDVADIHYNLGNALRNLDRPDEAIDCFTKAVQIKPDFAEAHNNLGNTFKELDRHNEAIASFTKAVKLNPGFAEAHYNLGNTLNALGRHDEAISYFTKAIEIKPDYAEAHNNLGDTLIAFDHLEEATNSFAKAIKIKPDYAEAHNNLGNALVNLNRREEAFESFNKAIKIDPEFAEAYNNLGNTLTAIDRRKEAIECYARAVQINPNNGEAYAQKLFQQARICDWKATDGDAATIPSLGVSDTTVLPFAMLSLDDDPARQLIRSERYSKKNFGQREVHGIQRRKTKPDRLSVGYFSADFHDHPGMHLMAKLFEVHDRDRFAIHAFSFGPDTEDEMRERVKNAFDEFHDVRSLSDIQTATLAREKSIDVAINRNVFTLNQRSGIFAHRAAPIQISFLGYPGTSGAPFMEYIIADKFVIPESDKEFYSEKIIYMPNTYLPTDNSREISDKPATRSEMGLPEQGFVFCCFNNNYKITPREYDIWMRLLDKIDGSVLWLLKANKWAEENLRIEAQERGINPKRIIFAERRPSPEHLARHNLADLFLDTFNYNAHTTASDALWTGLPLVTKPGRGFVSRVAGSLLSAIGLPELITETDEEYESLAYQLASNPDKLAAIKSKLAKNRNTTPLFDTELFARHIEDAYQQAYQRYFDGKDPDVIEVQG